MKNIKISKKSNKRNIKKKRISNQRKGFTLIEIIAVIIIIGIISIIAVPAVINYISNAKKTTYTSYESSMKQAAENQILACVNGNEENCLIPNVIDEKQSIPLSSLVDQGYIDLMKNPESNDFCDKDLSYVEVKKIGDENFEYIACLYCGEYQTENASCTTYTLDGDEPTCGEITGASTRWTKERRTISVKCSDPTSGCTNSSFSKSFNTTTKEGSITIVDRSGRTKVCNVNVYVDKTKPTCEIKASGNYLEDYGWYILEADADLENMKDNESGLLTYGIGKSIQNRNYNKKTHMKLGSGITTVVGYVKDIAGNEGLCAQDIRVGTEKPKFNIYYGYGLFPKTTNDSDSYTTSGITVSGSDFKTTSNTPKITFNNISKYGEIRKVVITLSSAIDYTTIGKILNGSTEITTGLMTTGSKKIVFNLGGRTLNELTIQLGAINGATYKINRIEVLTTNGNRWTSKDVTVTIEPNDEGVATTEASFDNGNSFSTNFVKTYNANSSAVAKTKNTIGMISEGKTISITGIDKVVPTATIVAKKKNSGTTISSGTWTNEGLNFTFNQGTVGISGAKIYYCKDTNNTCTPNTEISNGEIVTNYNGITSNYYIRYRIISNAGLQSEIYSYQAKLDVTKPTCSFGTAPTIYTTKTATIDLTCTDSESMLVDTTLSAGDFSLSNTNITITGLTKSDVTNGKKYTLSLSGNTKGDVTITLNADKISDNAGNKNNSVSTAISVIGLYKITLNNQSADTTGTTEIYEKYGYGWYDNNSLSNTVLSIEKPKKAGYSFGGYYSETNGTGTLIIDSNGTMVAGNKTFEQDSEIYAKWNIHVLKIQLSGANTNTKIPVATTLNITQDTIDREVMDHYITNSVIQNVSSVPVTWCGNRTYSLDSNNVVNKSGSVYYLKANYGESITLPKNNETSNICFDSDFYIAEPDLEWTIGSTKLNHDTSYEANNLATYGGCDLSESDCTITAKVSWRETKVKVNYYCNGGIEWHHNTGNPYSGGVDDPPCREAEYGTWSTVNNSSPSNHNYRHSCNANFVLMKPGYHPTNWYFLRKPTSANNYSPSLKLNELTETPDWATFAYYLQEYLGTKRITGGNYFDKLKDEDITIKIYAEFIELSNPDDFLHVCEKCYSYDDDYGRACNNDKYYDKDEPASY